MIVNTTGELLENELLCNYTTWRVGGKARYLFKPKDVCDLSRVLKQLPKNYPVLWLGLGSNSLVRDQGFDGLVVLTQGRLKGLELLDNGHVFVEAGVSCAQMARFCARNALSDAEFWAGIPGTMGGALRMNAGCYGGETWDHIVSVRTMNQLGEIKEHSVEAFNVGYRSVQGLGENEWFISAEFKLRKGDKQKSLAKIKELLESRNQSQPTGDYNCGSVFRNPPGDYAARLIEFCGLKGYQQGGACVSNKHANFITNTGNAKASDIEALISHVADEVYQKTGIRLIQEVHVVG
jgi:UDP-N-acetylmuramate dehydrogenase